VQYVGERSVVEEQVKRSLHGTIKPIPKNMTITAITIGEFPETLPTDEAAERFGSHVEDKR
jgi:hypothetical protein